MTGKSESIVPKKFYNKEVKKGLILHLDGFILKQHFETEAHLH